VVGIFGNNNNDQTVPVVDHSAVTNDQPVSIDGVMAPATNDQASGFDNTAPTIQDTGTDVPANDYIMTDPVTSMPNVQNSIMTDSGVQSPAYNDSVGAPINVAQEQSPQIEAIVALPVNVEVLTDSLETESLDHTPIVQEVMVDPAPVYNEPTTSFDQTDNGEREEPRVAPAHSDRAYDSDLSAIKQQALQQLSPLISHLNQSPEERFNTTMMMLQATDDQSLVSVAYEAAQTITDDKTKAQALLDIVNEINYFASTSK